MIKHSGQQSQEPDWTLAITAVTQRKPELLAKTVVKANEPSGIH